MPSLKILLPGALLFSLLALSCKETIVEYRDVLSPGKPTMNDEYHGDIVGKVLQTGSHAVVYAKQVNIVDSAQINPVDGSFTIQSLRLGNYDLTVKADNYRIYTRSNVIVPGGGIMYVGDLDLSTVPDLIASIYPQDKDEIVYDNQFARLSVSIMFTQPMDRASVEAAFSTDPPSTGVFYWGSYIYSPVYDLYRATAESYSPTTPGAVITTYSKITAVTYVMSRRSSFVDTTYTVTLTTAAHDTAGHHLRFPLVEHFRTVEAGYTVYGIQSSPVDGDIDIAPLSYSGIQVTFPRRMDQTSTEAALTVTPSDSRIVLWPQGNVMTIYMGGVFRTSATYVVTIDSTALDLDKNPLGQRFSFSFRTAPVQVAYTYPSNGQLFVVPGSAVTMNFNTYVLKSTAEASFSISPPVSGTIAYGGTYQDIRSIIQFIPTSAMAHNTKYTIRLTTGVQDMFGTHMESPFTFSFVTSPE